MSYDFLLGVAETAIGSTLGFGFGIWAFRYQQSRQSAALAKSERRAALDALNRLSTAAGANIEALANAKLQFINDMRPEVDKMKAAVKKFYDTPGPERDKKLVELKILSETMLYFYHTLPRTFVMPPPGVVEYSVLSKEMPALTLFVHRAMGTMQELNERIESRNALIAEHARESGTGTGMSGERLIYFSSMGADEGESICENTDFALNFWRLVLDQIKAYMTAKAKNEYFVEYKLVPKAVEAMPNEELVPLMREQLTKYDNQELSK